MEMNIHLVNRLLTGRQLRDKVGETLGCHCDDRLCYGRELLIEEGKKSKDVILKKVELPNKQLGSSSFSRGLRKTGSLRSPRAALLSRRCPDPVHAHVDHLILVY
jgi:hypothetical protein